MILRHLALATSLVAVAAPAAAQQQAPIAQAVKLADWQLAHIRAAATCARGSPRSSGSG